MGRRCLAISLFACALVAPQAVQATYSTISMERATGRYGVVMASCVQLNVLQRAYASISDQGAVLTQSYLVEGDASQGLALQLLGQGAQASGVIAAMTDPEFDADFALRQYVVLDADGRLAAFTGVGARPFASHLDASDASFSLGIAGNILTGPEVLDRAVLGFRDPAACDLEARLVNAVVAASAPGLGDARCVADARPAQSAWLHVAGTNGAPALDIAVDAAPGIDPIQELVARFSEWRSEHPCPSAPEISNTPSSPAPRDSRTSGCTVTPATGNSSGCWLWLFILLGWRRAQTRRAGLECAEHAVHLTRRSSPGPTCACRKRSAF